jgi:hypothetical protein
MLGNNSLAYIDPIMGNLFFQIWAFLVQVRALSYTLKNDSPSIPKSHIISFISLAVTFHKMRILLRKHLFIYLSMFLSCIYLNADDFAQYFCRYFDGWLRRSYRGR